MNRIALIALAGLSLTLGACATQPQPMTTAQHDRLLAAQEHARQQASFDCQYPLAVDARNYDALYLASGLPAVDEHGNTYGLSLRGYDKYMRCMSRKGYEIADAQPE